VHRDQQILWLDAGNTGKEVRSKAPSECRGPRQKVGGALVELVEPARDEAVETVGNGRFSMFERACNLHRAKGAPFALGKNARSIHVVGDRADELGGLRVGQRPKSDFIQAIFARERTHHAERGGIVAELAATCPEGDERATLVGRSSYEV